MFSYVFVEIGYYSLITLSHKFRAGSIICHPGIPMASQWAIPLWAGAGGQEALGRAAKTGGLGTVSYHGVVAEGRRKVEWSGGFAVDMSEINRKSDSKDGDLM